MEQFRNKVVDYVKLTDEIAESSKALCLIRKRRKELQASIIQHMTDHKIDQCNLRDGTLVLKSKKASPPINEDLLLEALKEQVGQDRAEALTQSVTKHRETNQKVRQSLKRTKTRTTSQPADQSETSSTTHAT
jgi:hypothetical protein